MIARVRIAPLKYWCHVEYDNGNFHLLPGFEIEIFTESMDVVAPCGGRGWLVAAASLEKIGEIVGLYAPPHGRYVCEHMVEMD